MSFLFEMGVRGLVVMAIGAGLVMACRRRTPAVRHAILASGFCVLLLLPLQIAFGPRWQPSIVAPPSARVAAETTEVPALLRAAARAPVLAPVDRSTSMARGTPAHGVPWAQVIVAIYLGGIAVLIVRNARAARRIARLVSRARPLPATDPLWTRLEAAGRSKRRRWRSVESEECTVPFVAWPFRPVLVLPVDFRHWDDEVARLVLRHELAHIERRDILVRWVADLASIVHWFDPAVWFVARRLRVLGELACDAQALEGGPSEHRYAELLVGLAHTGQRRGLLRPALAASARSELGARIDALLDARPLRPSARAAAFAAAVAALLHGFAAICLPARAARGPAGSPQSTLNWSEGGADVSTNAAGLQSRWNENGRHAGLFASGDIHFTFNAGGVDRAPGDPGMLIVLSEEPSGLQVFEAHDRVDSIPEWARAVLDRGARRIEALQLAPHPDRPQAAPAPEKTPPPSPTPKALQGSGSTLVGLPAVSDDPTERVVQAGWLDGGRRHGVFVRGTWRVRHGKLQCSEPGAWIFLFSFDPVTGGLERLTATRTADGETTVECAVDGVATPLDAPRIDWATGLLRTLAKVTNSGD